MVRYFCWGVTFPQALQRSTGKSRCLVEWPNPNLTRSFISKLCHYNRSSDLCHVGYGCPFSDLTHRLTQDITWMRHSLDTCTPHSQLAHNSGLYGNPWSIIRIRTDWHSLMIIKWYLVLLNLFLTCCAYNVFVMRVKRLDSNTSKSMKSSLSSERKWGDREMNKHSCHNLIHWGYQIRSGLDETNE